MFSGCSSTPPEAVTLPAGVTVSILQNRDDYGPRRLEIAVANASDTDVTVTRATFSSARFDEDAAWERSTAVPAGSTRNLRVELGATVCEPQTAPDTVELRFELPNGRTGATTVEPASPFGAIETVVAQDCAEQLTEETVGITLGDTVRTEQRKGHPVAQLDVTFTPTTTGAPVSIGAIRRTILLRPADGTDTWPVDTTFAAGGEPVTITLDVVPANCRLHTVTEDKRGTYFPFETTTDAGDGLFYLAATTAVKEQFYAYIADYCGWDASTAD